MTHRMDVRRLSDKLKEALDQVRAQGGREDLAQRLEELYRQTLESDRHNRFSRRVSDDDGSAETS